MRVGDKVIIGDGADVSPQIRGRSGVIVQSNAPLHGQEVATSVLVEIDGPPPKAGARWYVSLCSINKG